jgi:dienelactone hydrolase
MECYVITSEMRLVLLALLSAVSFAHARASDPPPLRSPYTTAHDQPLEVEQRTVSETPEFTQLRVEFNGIAKDRVPAFLYLPAGDAAKRPAVLLQYGSGGNKNTNYIVALGRQFIARGFIVLTIDVPGRGERKSPDRKSPDWVFTNEGRELFLQYCGDYSRAVDYLTSRPDVDSDRISYVGISWGAITGITFAAHDPRIKAMASVVGGGNFLRLAGVLAKPDEEGEMPISIDPVHHVARIAPRPLMLLNVTRDQLVPRPFADALHAAAGDGAKKVWLDTDHFFSTVDRGEMGEMVIRFVTESLPRRKDE